MSTAHSLHPIAAGGARAEDVPGSIRIRSLGYALSSFFVISYVLCILGYLALPEPRLPHAALAIFLPGFALLSWRTFFLGLVESIVWGWYIAVLFGWLYNFFLRRAH